MGSFTRLQLPVLQQHELCAKARLGLRGAGISHLAAASHTLARPRPPPNHTMQCPRPASSVSKLSFEWGIEVAEIRRMVGDAKLWNRVVEAQSPLHYFAGVCAGRVCARKACAGRRYVLGG